MILFFVFGPYLSPNAGEHSSIWCVMGLWLLALTIIATFFGDKKCRI